MIRTQVSLDEKAYRDAKREAKREGVSLAEFVRRALASALAAAARESGSAGEGSKPWLEYAGCLRSGDPRAGETVDDVVYGRPHP